MAYVNSSGSHSSEDEECCSLRQESLPCVVFAQSGHEVHDCAVWQNHLKAKYIAMHGAIAQVSQPTYSHKDVTVHCLLAGHSMATAYWQTSYAHVRSYCQHTVGGWQQAVLTLCCWQSIRDSVDTWNWHCARQVESEPLQLTIHHSDMAT